MAGLETAASVIAVLELSAKVSSLCFQYYSAVKNAKNDVERLRGELDQLKATLQGAQQLLESPNAARLKTSQQLCDGLGSCSSQLIELQREFEKKLRSGTRQKVMSRFGRSALKWPFESKDVDKILESFRRCRDMLTAALAVDQTREVLQISQELVLSKLRIAEHAAFDSYTDEYDVRCHPETRVDLLKKVIRWADDPQGECIFWLKGMAGTGKSTISRTLAQTFADEGCLGASFFFKRGERDRGSAALLFTTISTQLITWEPALAPYVRAAIESHPTVAGKGLKEQFERLILEPLGDLERHLVKRRRVVLVIDALDECERDDDIRMVIYLLSLTKTLSSIQIRAFVTSRPEVPIRLGFNEIKGKYQDLVLHDIPQPVIEHDISVFLADKLQRIRHDYNSTCRQERRLPPDWPGSSIVQTLVQMAIPLFIFAATVCRFIEDKAWSDPAAQLLKILRHQSSSQNSEMDKLDATYRPVLDQLIVGRPKTTQRALAEEFRKVVGSIVLLAEALSISSLARLLDTSESVVDRRLEGLHSVLSIPSSTKYPVRMFHLSFRDFLVDPEKRDNNPFWVDEKATHEQIAVRCLELLSTSGHLKKDICDLKRPGATHADVPPSTIESCLPSEIRYACLYWVHHLRQSEATVTDDHPAHVFLRHHFLHWLEALSLLGKISESIGMINSLQALVSVSEQLPFYTMRTDFYLTTAQSSTYVHFNSILLQLFLRRERV